METAVYLLPNAETSAESMGQVSVPLQMAISLRVLFAPDHAIELNAITRALGTGFSGNLRHPSITLITTALLLHQDYRLAGMPTLPLSSQHHHNP